MDNNSVYIGFDSVNYGQTLAYEVCKRSIQKYNNNIVIHKLIKKELEEKKIFNRDDNSGSTEFTYTRFLVPYLNNYKGWCLFCDSDFVWFCDIHELFTQFCNDKYAVLCVKHKYENCNNNIKMNGIIQEWYPRKNWSSLMLFNCSHPSIQNLSIENINNKSSKWLHRMEWCNDNEIGEIDISYNYLVNYYSTHKYKALHYTDGGPWNFNYRYTQYYNEWITYLTSYEVDNLNKELKKEYINTILCCIPARFNSSRLNGKPLFKINNKTIIQMVYEQTLKTIINKNNIIILTDNNIIYDEVNKWGGKCIIIEDECINGTERIINYLKQINHNNYKFILNIQGDEPYINPDAINKLIENHYHKYINNVCSTICYKTNNIEDIKLKSKGKVIINNNNNIIYCSRNIIPASKNNDIIDTIHYNIHVGVFIYNKDYLLNNFCKENTYYQILEDIEWLKIIEQGFNINTIIYEKIERGIDTMEDYNYLIQKYNILL